VIAHIIERNWIDFVYFEHDLDHIPP